MIEWLGIGHLFELSGAEALAGLLAPPAICAALLLAQLVLPGRRVPGYVVDPETGAPRDYRLNGLSVFALAQIVWALELTGMPREWFYRSTVYQVAGGTILCLVLAGIAVFTQPRREEGSPLAALWAGRALELSFLNARVDLKMYLYVVGGTMLSLNALSGAAYHYGLFGADSNPGIFLYAGFLTFFVLDYFIFERVHLYTYDLIHERLGFKMIWGGLIVYGWLYFLPLWGMAVYPDPGFSTPWREVWLVGAPVLFLVGWGIARGANMQKYTFKRWPERSFLGLIEPEYIEAGGRRILCSGFWGVARHLNYLGEVLLSLSIALVFGYFGNPWAWTYFVFAVGLFSVRQRLDDGFCAEKYGPEKWAEYQARVKYRIIPGIY